MNRQFYTKHGDWLIPVLCVLIIFQTIVLIGDNARVIRIGDKLPVINKQTTPTPIPPAANIEIVPQTQTVIKNKPVTVEIWLKPKRLIILGGMDLVLKFDPKMATVSRLETSKVFSLVIPNRQSEKNGRLFITYLDEDGGGITVDGRLKLASVTLTAKQAGSLGLSIVSSTTGATTVLADKVSSNSLPFTASDLILNVSEN